jgi:hypothetical protein
VGALAADCTFYYRFTCRLLYFARHHRKYIVGISTDQPDCADDYDEDNSQHYGVFGNVLAFIVRPDGL